MNRKQMLAVLLIVLAIFFSLTSLIFNIALSRAENLHEQSLEENATVGYGIIQLIVESPKGKGGSYEEGHKR